MFALPISDLLTVYNSYVRPLLENTAPVWNAGITKAQVSMLESVQKRALRIILGERYETYEHALAVTGTIPLSDCPQSLSLNFAKTFFLVHPIIFNVFLVFFFISLNTTSRLLCLFVNHYVI